MAILQRWAYVATTLSLFLMLDSVLMITPPQCETGEPLSPRLAKACSALKAISEYTNYLEEMWDQKALNTIAASDVKRQENPTQHLFLRFGKRR